MEIKVSNLKPNPFRNIDNFPIDREKVEALKTEIEKDDLKPIFGFFLASLSYLFNKEKRQLIFRDSI